ncbi:MAG: hypothetical protein QOF78_4279 [Phycisphaerales bacterium]|jgi:hypothetical protein|nr:hypothetical protein [Phycisphaerales bacterium]
MANPPRQFPPPQVTAAGRFIGAVFGIAFATVGLVVIGSLWFSDGMGDPPIIFKLVGSCIALVFVAMGSTLAFSAITGGGLMARGGQAAATADEASAAATGKPRGYTCPHCGGGLDERAEVSPMGDVKCSFCGRWFNVHGRT